VAVIPPVTELSEKLKSVSIAYKLAGNSKPNVRKSALAHLVLNDSNCYASPDVTPNSNHKVDEEFERILSTYCFFNETLTRTGIYNEKLANSISSSVDVVTFNSDSCYAGPSIKRSLPITIKNAIDIEREMKIETNEVANICVEAFFEGKASYKRTKRFWSVLSERFWNWINVLKSKYNKNANIG
jgi:hypothetical protein